MLTLHNLTRSYGSTLALDDVSAQFERGRVIGLLGENGAGKTTLLSILSGADRADGGTVTLDNVPCAFSSTGEAMRAGIAHVRQHPALVPTFTVREQLALGGWHSRDLPESLRGVLEPGSTVESLGPAQRQRLEIARATLDRPRVLLLDEPTSALSVDQVAALFADLRAWANDGLTVVIVSHKLDEVLSIADDIVVLRQGRIVATHNGSGGKHSPDLRGELLTAMFGVQPAELPLLAAPIKQSGHQGGLQVDVEWPYGAGGRLELDVPHSTMLGVASLEAAAQSALIEVLTGHRRFVGRLLLNGRELRREVRGDFGGNVGYVSAERLTRGTVGQMTVAENLMLGRQAEPAYSRMGILRRDSGKKAGGALVREWGIVPDQPNAPLAALSGGNIQRVVIARALDTNPALLVVENPVHGLDVQSAMTVWSRLRSYCRSGGTCVAFVPDLDEIIANADQVSVMAGGRLLPPVPARAADVGELRSMMVNGWR